MWNCDVRKAFKGSVSLVQGMSNMYIIAPVQSIGNYAFAQHVVDMQRKCIGCIACCGDVCDLLLRVLPVKRYSVHVIAKMRTRFATKIVTSLQIGYRRAILPVTFICVDEAVSDYGHTLCHKFNGTGAHIFVMCGVRPQGYISGTSQTPKSIGVSRHFIKNAS